jgi:hypothetical protein
MMYDLFLLSLLSFVQRWPQGVNGRRRSPAGRLALCHEFDPFRGHEFDPFRGVILAASLCGPIPCVYTTRVKLQWVPTPPVRRGAGAGCCRSGDSEQEQYA